MKLTVLLLSLLVTNVVRAEASHHQMEIMLNQMVKDNVISAEEANKARVRLKTMNSEQWKTIKASSVAVASRGPASSQKQEDISVKDLERAQLNQIQEDMKKFAPHYR